MNKHIGSQALWVFITLLTLMSLAFAATYSPGKPIYAAKLLALDGLNEKQTQKTVNDWQQLGIQQIFALDHIYQLPEFRKQLAKTNIKPWLIHQTFFSNHNDLSQTPDWFAITETGQYAQDNSKEGNWLAMACPNNADYKQQSIERAVKQVKAWQPYGLSIDFIRYFAFWELSHVKGHEGYDGHNDPLIDSCFCDTCMQLFFQYLNMEKPKALTTPTQLASWIHDNKQDEWVNFKVQTITSMVKDLVTAVKQVKPDIKINIHAVPWLAGEHNNAVQRITGQSIKELAPYVDYVSPMAYAEMMLKPARWMHDLVIDMKQQCSNQCEVIPAFQVSEMYDSGEITEKEFQSYIREASKAPSAGVVFWPWETLTQQQKNYIKTLTR
ncbi:poly-beta-1,6-N-acetyl-D-glucosamine N-deacetylase PgaB [Teredinibacter sp. KSP-S5-2]|uniref:poly-beta-1,6-N-acetyl-D-glucosamine N-deacetylase PgaB n=1 Tax=Teredinibacter sp. KSP-S5-2 TaxID=3034506 RepID=UPI0029342E61|nr:poly-beta-1,6-N-acetyl-D-glucosamine N-deacetylase PgaB [Teredinibacter sp. KSP-S5-2]WNO09086.1 poly-beta-1,6-N-acetyl-D-glucosamine N-deacetylase PgaB [Teredinibacter sp. KSP-S5-2]